MKIGVLALQGDFREHINLSQELGHSASAIRRPEELPALDALILPGGESTTISLLAQSYGLYAPIQEAIRAGLPVYGSCAGMILLADHILDGAADQKTFGGLDITVRRNAFGRQVDSFEGEIEFVHKPLNAIFIRAPWVEAWGEGVEVLAQVSGHPVAVRQGKLLATSFHPEISGDHTVHRYFFDEICK